MTLTTIKKAGLDEIALDHVFTIGASGTSAYTFQGEGLNGTVNNPTLYLTRGKTYRFENGSGGHPLRIQSTSGQSGTAYNTGVTNNNTTGTVIVEVQHDAPDVLYYQCTSHAAMNGILYTVGALADGGVTTAKLADDGVTQAKIAAGAIGNTELASGAVSATKIDTGAVTAAKIGSGAVGSSQLASDAVTTAKIADSQITTAKIADDAVTTAKIADANVTTDSIADGSINAGKLANNAVTTSKILDEAVSLSKLEHGTSSNDGKFLRANNGADPTFESIPTPSSFVTGMIIMWNSTVASIPSGWVLCDGNNSTPDLRDKFIVGAKQDDSGTAKTNVSGSLTQTGGSATDSVTSTGNWYGATRIGQYGTNDNAKQLSIGHTTTVYAHSGNRFQRLTGYRYDISTLTLNNIEVSGTADTIPPYYALCFIMKT